MVITRNTKLSIFIGSLFLLLLSASILTDKLVLFSAVIIGVIIFFLLINNPVKLIYAQILYNCFVKFAIWSLGVPSILNYVTDILTLLIVIAAIRKLLSDDEKKSNMLLPMVIVVLFVLSTVVGLIINEQSIPLYMWGFRNNFRFYGFFFGCAILLKKKDIDVIFKIFIYLSFINVLFCIIQFFVFGISVDNLGGIFGTTVGVNSYLDIFLCIVTTIVIVQFLSKKASISLLLFTIISGLFISVIGELKIFFIQLPLIVLGFTIFSKPNLKTILVFCFTILGIVAGIDVFYRMFPYWDNFFSLDKIISTSQYYSSANDLGRLTATSTITKMFLSESPSKFFFGLGLGSAEISQFSMFTSDFYMQYGQVLHYTWLSDAFILIENGWIGLTLYMLFFISVIFSTYKIRREHNEFWNYCIISQIFAMLCCMLAVYNSSLRTEAGYLAYFIISLPFVLYRNDRLKKMEEYNKCLK